MQIGQVAVSGAGLSPMAGVTDAAMRLLCFECGAGWAVSEMVSAKGWVYSMGKSQNTQELLLRLPGEGAAGLQLFGREPEYMAEAAHQLESLDFAFIDINMGCPAPKIAGNGEGSALMREPELAFQIVRSVVQRVSKPVTVKIRSGWDESSINAPEFARGLEDAGAAAVAVHARTRQQYYSGKADWNIIQRVKKSVSIPVIGNGDIFSGEDAVHMLDFTGCDGVLVGRGAQGNPWIFEEISASLEGRTFAPPDARARMEMALKHLNMEIALHGERRAVPEMRKHIAWYAAGLRGAARFRERINRLSTAEDVRQALLEFAEAAGIE